MRGPCISSFFTLIGTVSITEDGNGSITGVFLPSDNLPSMDQGETPALKEAAKQIEEYLSGKRTEFDLEMSYEVSDFRSKVMGEISKIPYGTVRTYGEVAEAIGRPGSSRAVGTACRENPLPILIPCHRVIPTTGGYGNYAGGTGLKRKLLNLEGVHLDRLPQDARGISRAGLRQVHVQAHPRQGRHHGRPRPETEGDCQTDHLR